MPLFALANPASAKFRVLYSFCAEVDCVDGASPSGRVLQASDGTLYGTTAYGGNLDKGVIYALMPRRAHYKFKVLHSFCGDGTGGCADGGVPVSDLIMDAAGNLYGTTFQDGPQGGGTAFKFLPNSGHTKWKFKTLYGFCSFACSGGTGPDTTLTYAGAASGVPYDGVSPLFGTTSRGGDADAGVAYELTPAGKTWNETVLHSFCSKDNCRDGKYPQGVVADAAGNLYGTTSDGGPFASSGGIFFELKSGTFDERDLYDFCSVQHCPDGSNPIGTVTLDANGLVVGTTRYGGSLNGGVIFRIEKPGREDVLQSLSAPAEDGVTIDSNGKIYGAMSYGAGQNAGAIFRLSEKDFKLLHVFCTVNHPVACADGNFPTSVMVDATGAIFGTTARGGLYDQGVAFRVAP